MTGKWTQKDAEGFIMNSFLPTVHLRDRTLEHVKTVQFGGDLAERMVNLGYDPTTINNAVRNLQKQKRIRIIKLFSGERLIEKLG